MTPQKEKALIAFKKANSLLTKVIKMVEEDTYCIDVLHQSQAVQAALKETDGVVLENHLRTCVSDSMKSGNQEKAIKEVMEVFKKKG